MVTQNSRKKLSSGVKGGICGAVIMPLMYIGLAILQSLVPDGSTAYSIIHGILWGAVAPVFIPLDLMGIYGCNVMAYIIPIFLLIALYLAAIGFGIGSLTALFARIKSDFNDKNN